MFYVKTKQKQQQKASKQKHFCFSRDSDFFSLCLSLYEYFHVTETNKTIAGLDTYF